MFLRHHFSKRGARADGESVSGQQPELRHEVGHPVLAPGLAGGPEGWVCSDRRQLGKPSAPQGNLQVPTLRRPGTVLASRVPEWWGTLTVFLPRGCPNSRHPTLRPETKAAPPDLAWGLGLQVLGIFYATPPPPRGRNASAQTSSRASLTPAPLGWRKA